MFNLHLHDDGTPALWWPDAAKHGNHRATRNHRALFNMGDVKQLET